MSLNSKIFLILVLVLFLGANGCVTISRTESPGDPEAFLNTSKNESTQEAASALSAVASSVSNKKLSKQELYDAAKKMRNDPEARTAVEAVESAFDPKDVQVKYSPVTGKRYSANLQYDPETGVKLLPVK